ncbi:hypothetical protein [Deinococcus navajonensis]|uniref:Uncharacterized protein n=1 Tax=Deinococcus navajonensis TaxID=309884 RepID=A0ABV8XPF3_9DEIO
MDGQPVFYGICPDPPSLGSPDAEVFTVLGGREALRLSTLDDTVFRGQGVYQIVRQILATTMRPDAIKYTATNIGNGTGTDAGASLDLFYSPTNPLSDVFDELAKAANVTWSVGPDGEARFGQLAHVPLVVPYAGQPWRRLPVQGRETVTRSVLRVATNLAGIDAVRFIDHPNYLPATVTTEAELPEHPVYQASQAFEPPEGVALVRPERFTDHTQVNVTNPGSAYDGDPATFALLQDSAASPPLLNLRMLGSHPPRRPVGLELTYQTLGSARVRVELQYSQPARTAALPVVQFMLPESSGTSTTRLVIPPPAASSIDPSVPWTFSAIFTVLYSGASPAPELRLMDASWLYVDEDAALRSAQSHLQVPFAAPAEITLPELVSPTGAVTVTGSPDGDVTGPVELLQYEHTPENPRTTRLRMGTTGTDPNVRALRWSVKQ